MRKWWDSLGFFSQVYLTMVGTFIVGVGIVEFLLEPAILSLLRVGYAEHRLLCDVIVWLFGALTPSLLVGWILTRMVAVKLDRLKNAAVRIAEGDLSVRVGGVGEANTVFNQLGRSFNTMADFLERLLASEKRLLADISHELRSPLTRMGIGAALLAKKRESAEFTDLLVGLENEITRMNALVGMLLKQGRDRICEESVKQRFDLTRLVGETVEDFSRIAEERHKRIDVRLDGNMVVMGYPRRIRLVLDNILANAVFYAPAGSGIDIEVLLRDGRVGIVVRDYGEGVPPDRLPEIFNAFYRVDDSRSRRSGGVGLGLTLVREAVCFMEGEVTARNADPGLEVRVIIPVEALADAPSFECAEGTALPPGVREAEFMSSN